MTRRRWLALLGSAPLAAAENWERAPFPHWSPAIVERLLTDSPWAKPVTVPFLYQPPARLLPFHLGQIGGMPPWPGKPNGGSAGVRTEVYLTVRWSSALPIRQAVVLDDYGPDWLANPKAIDFLGREPEGYVLEVFGLPARMAPQGAKRLQEQFRNSAALWVKGQTSIPAADALVPEHGEHLAVKLRFPRSPSLTAPDADILEFRAEAGPIRIVQKFKRKTMFYRGELAL